jgi:tripartite-type tricarboxylate transporter receptor subunit TctC
MRRSKLELTRIRFASLHAIARKDGIDYGSSASPVTPRRRNGYAVSAVPPAAWAGYCKAGEVNTEPRTSVPFRNSCCSWIISSAISLAVPALSLTCSARAQTYPDHPVRIIVPVAAGAAYDIIGRLLANKLTEQTGQTFFVENRTGAGTLVGTQAAATAPADGYTLMVGGLSNIVFNFALYQKIPYEPDDFVPVAVVYTFPYVMVARHDLPQKDLAEIVSYGRQSPGKLTVAHPGSGSGQQIVAAAFMKRTATTIVEVPYRSARAAYPDLIAGRVDLLFDSLTTALPYLVAQKVRGVGLLAPQRYAKMPNLPTMAEAGVPGLDIESWIGLFAPAGTPPEVLGRLRQETRIAAAELKEPFERTGGALMQLPIAETNKFIKSEFDLWTKVIREAGIRLD